MIKSILRYIFVITVLLAVFSVSSSAQFREEAFTQSYNDSTATGQKDTTDKLFSFKELFGGLAHKTDLRIGTMFGSSVVLPGISQIYNRDYWKLPITYAGIGTCAGLGGYYLQKHKKSVQAYNADLLVNPNTQLTIDYRSKTTGNLLLAGAGLIYWATLLDGVINYKPELHPLPGRATIYSILLPGLGQAYNGEFWKMPIYWGCLMGAGHFLYTNNLNYQRFKRIHNETFQEGYSENISRESAQYYRDSYRRFRDYSIVALVGFYMLQIIDANVFAYMHDFEVSDDLSMSIEPAIISPYNEYALNMPSAGPAGNAVGFRLGITF